MSAPAFEFTPQGAETSLAMPSILDVEAVIDPRTGEQKPVSGIRHHIKDAVPMIEVTIPPLEEKKDPIRENYYIAETLLRDGRRARIFPLADSVHLQLVAESQ